MMIKSDKKRAVQHTEIVQDGGITGGTFFYSRLVLLLLLVFFSTASLSQSTTSPHHVFLAPEKTSLPCPNEKIAFDFQLDSPATEAIKSFWMMWFTMRTFSSDDPATEAELRAIGFNRFQKFNNSLSGLQAYLAGSDQALILAFRGSTQAIDCVIDANMGMIDAQALGISGKVHHGFSYQFRSEWKRINQAIDLWVRPNTPIFVTGHSLGGALATMAAYKLAKEGYPVAGLYSFAAPRSGDKTYASDGNRLLSGRSLRVINDRDLIARYPPRAESLGWISDILNLGKKNPLQRWLEFRTSYAHEGRLLIFNHEGTPIEIEDADLSDDLHIWSSLAKLSKWRGIIRLFSETAEKQKYLHDEKTYLCLMNRYRKSLE